MAKPRCIKCQFCGVSDTPKEEMTFELVGKNATKKYIHPLCYPAYQEEKAFKEQERLELDRLVETLKRIYGVKQIPNQAYPLLQDLRNGNRFFGKYDYNYKKGYTYALIADAFDYCSETIDYWNGQKNFDGFIGAFRYGLAIVCDKLSVVEKRQKHLESQRAGMDKHIENLEAHGDEFETSYKKPVKSNSDITRFLDD